MSDIIINNIEPPSSKVAHVQPTLFTGYQHQLKTLYKQGKMPSVKRGLYGGLLTVDNTSLEHLKPHSQGGKTEWGNLALAERKRNTARGSKPLANFLSWEMLEKYLAQFNFRISGLFDGFAYQDKIRATCRKLGVKSKKDILIPFDGSFEPTQKLSKKVLRSMRNKAKKKTPKQLEIEFPAEEHHVLYVNG